MHNLKSPNSDPDTLRAVLKEYLSWLKQIFEWRQFRETRNCIKREEDLFDVSDEELKQYGLITPFKFNIQEIILAALPPLIFSKVFDFFFPYEVKAQEIKMRTRFGKTMVHDADILIDGIYFILTPVLPALVVFLMAWVVSRACLKDQDPKLKDKGTKKLARQRCKRAYYYYNGTYGLMPQTLLALSVTFWRSNSEQRNVESVSIFITFCILFSVAVSYQLYVTYYKIPNLLFELNEYSKKEFSLTRRTQPQPNPPPYTKYVLGVLNWNALLGLTAKYVLPLLVAIAAGLIAFIEVWLRRRFGMLP